MGDLMHAFAFAIIFAMVAIGAYVLMLPTI
jgi:hypothetical protein